jgi:hypothetical protein
MKKVLLFIVLKVVEIIVGGPILVGIYLTFCKFGYWFDGAWSEQDIDVWYSFEAFIVGLAVAVSTVLAIGLVYLIVTELIPIWFRINKRWVDRILD